MILMYAALDFAVKANTGNLDPTIFALIIKFVIVVVMIVALMKLPLRKGILITTSNLTLKRFFFSKSFSKRELNKSDFSLTAIYKQYRQNTGLYYVLLLQSEKYTFRLLTFTDINDKKVESYIKLLRELGVTIDDIFDDTSSSDDMFDD